eukprot:Amastigsp_a510533_183.p3 type:complete len:109 gc:universal Amastigsp_a510533_183:1361-1687(+)
MRDKGVLLTERARVEEHLDAFASSELAALVLLVNALLTTTNQRSLTHASDLELGRRLGGLQRRLELGRRRTGIRARRRCTEGLRKGPLCANARREASPDGSERANVER